MADNLNRPTIKARNFLPMISFWTIFALIMGFGLPIFIHTQQGDWKYNHNHGAGMAFFYLGLGLFLWLLLIFLFSNKFLFSLIRKRKKLIQLQKTGKRLKARIINSHLFESDQKGQSLVLDLEFKNFAGSVVGYSMNVFDSKPEKRRFEKGKEITLLVDDSTKNPVITLEDAQIGWNAPILTLILIVLAVIIITPTGLLIYGYLYESQGYGFRYLDFWHPFIMAPIMGLIYVGILMFINSFFMKPDNSERLLMFGKSTVATIRGASETGISINDQPQILVNVEFEHEGKTIQASYKRVYSLLSLSRLTSGQPLKIIYDAENPNYIEPNE